MYDADDIVDQKNREKRKQRIVKTFVFLLVASVIAGLAMTWEIWYPKLRGIGKQYKTIVNSGKLAEGNFPIKVSGGSGYQLKFTKNLVLVQSDTYLYFYDKDGALLKKRQHAYNNPILRAAGGCALVYDNGGNDISFENEEETFYTKSFDSSILFARLCYNGTAAVVTTAENYSCKLTVLDKKGTVIYERKCIEMVSDLSFIDGASGCVLSSITAENGRLTTMVKQISFSESGEKWTSPGFGTLALEIFGSPEGTFIYGDDSCGYIDTNGNISSYYQYEGTVAGGSSTRGKSAVVVNDDDRRKYCAVLFDGCGSDPLKIDLEKPAVSVLVYNDLAYVLTQNELLAYDFSGNLRSTASVNDTYTGFVRSEKFIFLKGYDSIDRIDYDAGK